MADKRGEKIRFSEEAVNAVKELVRVVEAAEAESTINDLVREIEAAKAADQPEAALRASETLKELLLHQVWATPVALSLHPDREVRKHLLFAMVLKGVLALDLGVGERPSVLLGVHPADGDEGFSFVTQPAEVDPDDKIAVLMANSETMLETIFAVLERSGTVAAFGDYLIETAQRRPDFTREDAEGTLKSLVSTVSGLQTRAKVGIVQAEPQGRIPDPPPDVLEQIEALHEELNLHGRITAAIADPKMRTYALNDLLLRSAPFLSDAGHKAVAAVVATFAKSGGTTVVARIAEPFHSGPFELEPSKQNVWMLYQLIRALCPETDRMAGLASTVLRGILAYRYLGPEEAQAVLSVLRELTEEAEKRCKQTTLQ